MKKKIVVAYVPVLHEGYRRFFEKHKDADTFYVFGTEIIKKFDYLRKEVRAVAPEFVRDALSAWFPDTNVEMLDNKILEGLSDIQIDLEIYAPNEDVTREIVVQHLPQSEVAYHPYFLRWNRDNVLKEDDIEASRTIEADEAMRELFSELHEEAKKSTFGWGEA